MLMSDNLADKWLAGINTSLFAEARRNNYMQIQTITRSQIGHGGSLCRQQNASLILVVLVLRLLHLRRLYRTVKFLPLRTYTRRGRAFVRESFTRRARARAADPICFKIVPS